MQDGDFKTIGKSCSKMSRDNDARVFLGRLPYRIRESDIERFFKGYGRIRDINVKTGFAFVVSGKTIFLLYFYSFFRFFCLRSLIFY